MQVEENADGGLLKNYQQTSLFGRSANNLKKFQPGSTLGPGDMAAEGAQPPPADKTTHVG